MSDERRNPDSGGDDEEGLGVVGYLAKPAAAGGLLAGLLWGTGAILPAALITFLGMGMFLLWQGRNEV